MVSNKKQGVIKWSNNPFHMEKNKPKLLGYWIIRFCNDIPPTTLQILQLLQLLITNNNSSLYRRKKRLLDV